MSATVRGRILVVEPMSSAATLLATARHQGLDVVVASFDEGDRRLPDDVRRLVSEFVRLETNDSAELAKMARRLHHDSPLMAVIPGFEFYVEDAARIAAELGLPGLPPADVSAIRRKDLMKARAQMAGIGCARFRSACSLHEAQAAAREIGYPCVLKPVDSAGSVHVSKVESSQELEAAYQWLVTDERTDLGRRLDGRVLVEEYVSGPEYSVEGYVLGGTTVVAAITEKLLGPEPFFVEIGHIVPAPLDPAKRAELELFVRSVVRALGVSMGPFHCEVRLRHGNDPVLIEIGARLPGDHIVDLVEMATGMSLPNAMLTAYADLQIDIQRPQARRGNCAGIRFFPSGGLHNLAKVEGAPDVRRLDGVVELELYFKAGDELPLDGDFRARLGHVIVAGDSYEFVSTTLAKAVAMLVLQ